MRDDELSRVPKSIEAWKIGEFLTSIGVTYSDVAEMVIEPRCVRLTVYARDESGRRFQVYEPADIDVTDMGEKEPKTIRGSGYARAAIHTLEIALSGGWKRPEACGVEHEFDFVRCQKPPGHPGHHGGLGDDGGEYAW